MHHVTLYCASSTRLQDAWYEGAATIGKSLAQKGLELVYGGGSIGLMGAAAKAAKAAGGRVHGVVQQIGGRHGRRPEVWCIDTVDCAIGVIVEDAGDDAADEVPDLVFELWWLCGHGSFRVVGPPS